MTIVMEDVFRPSEFQHALESLAPAIVATSATSVVASKADGGDLLIYAFAGAVIILLFLLVVYLWSEELRKNRELQARMVE